MLILPNLDKIVLFSLPWILIFTLFVLPEKVLFFSTTLIVTLFIFELMIYQKRELYGFTGLFNLSIPSVVTMTYTIFIAVPSIYICSAKTNPAIFPYFYSIVGFYYLYPMGLFMGDFLWGIDKKQITQLNHIYYDNFKKSKFDYIFAELLVFLLPLAIGLFLLYLLRVDTIPLLELFKNPGDYAKLSILRNKAYLVLKVTFIEKYLIVWARSVIFPVGIIASLFLLTVYRKRKYLIFFICFLVLGVIYTSITLEKSPVAGIFLALMAFYYLGKRKLDLKFLLTAIIIVFAIPVIIMAMKFYREEGLFDVLYTSILYRIFVVPAEALYYHYELFPGLYDFLGGRSTNLLAWFHPDGIFPLSNLVARYWWGSPTTVGTANAMFLGFFWADFGPIGVIISSYGVGIVTHWLYYKFLKISQYSKNIIFVVFSTVTLPAFTFSFFNSNYTILLISRGVLILLILLLIVNKMTIKIFKKSDVTS
jgi:oligosaccharide repeat unit polymerase